MRGEEEGEEEEGSGGREEEERKGGVLTGTKVLPPSLGKATSLRLLDISGNRVVKLPAELKQLGNLEDLNASSNLLAELPHEFGELKRLKVRKNLRDGIGTGDEGDEGWEMERSEMSWWAATGREQQQDRQRRHPLLPPQAHASRPPPLRGQPSQDAAGRRWMGGICVAGEAAGAEERRPEVSREAEMVEGERGGWDRRRERGVRGARGVTSGSDFGPAISVKGWAVRMSMRRCASEGGGGGGKKCQERFVCMCFYRRSFDACPTFSLSSSPLAMQVRSTRSRAASSSSAPPPASLACARVNGLEGCWQLTSREASIGVRSAQLFSELARPATRCQAWH
eukprot:766931-Hanusia_phi.AAC.1